MGFFLSWRGNKLMYLIFSIVFLSENFLKTLSLLLLVSTNRQPDNWTGANERRVESTDTTDAETAFFFQERVCLWLWFFFLIFIYLFMAVLGLRFCARAFSSCGKRGPLFIMVRRPLTITASLVAEHRLQTRRLSNCGSWAQLLRGMRDPPRPGLEPVFPALAGRLSTTAPPGKPYDFWLHEFSPGKIVLCLQDATQSSHQSWYPTERTVAFKCSDSQPKLRTTALGPSSKGGGPYQLREDSGVCWGEEKKWA